MSPAEENTQRKVRDWATNLICCKFQRSSSYLMAGSGEQPPSDWFLGAEAASLEVDAGVREGLQS